VTFCPLLFHLQSPLVAYFCSCRCVVLVHGIICNVYNILIKKQQNFINKFPWFNRIKVKKKKDKFVDLKQEQHCNSTMPLLEMLQKALCRNIPIAILVIIALS